MTRTIGKNVNISNESATTTISVGSLVAVKLVDALVTADQQPHMEVTITNNGNQTLWVRKRAASADNLKDGQRVSPGDHVKTAVNSDVWAGEVSAIFEQGGFNDVVVEIT